MAKGDANVKRVQTENRDKIRRFNGVLGKQEAHDRRVKDALEKNVKNVKNEDTK